MDLITTGVGVGIGNKSKRSSSSAFNHALSNYADNETKTNLTSAVLKANGSNFENSNVFNVAPGMVTMIENSSNPNVDIASTYETFNRFNQDVLQKGGTFYGLDTETFATEKGVLTELGIVKYQVQNNAGRSGAPARMLRATDEINIALGIEQYKRDLNGKIIGVTDEYDEIRKIIDKARTLANTEQALSSLTPAERNVMSRLVMLSGDTDKVFVNRSYNGTQYYGIGELNIAGSPTSITLAEQGLKNSAWLGEIQNENSENVKQLLRKVVDPHSPTYISGHNVRNFDMPLARRFLENAGITNFFDSKMLPDTLDFIRAGWSGDLTGYINELQNVARESINNQVRLGHMDSNHAQSIISTMQGKIQGHGAMTLDALNDIIQDSFVGIRDAGARHSAIADINRNMMKFFGTSLADTTLERINQNYKTFDLRVGGTYYFDKAVPTGLLDAFVGVDADNRPDPQFYRGYTIGRGSAMKLVNSVDVSLDHIASNIRGVDVQKIKEYYRLSDSDKTLRLNIFEDADGNRSFIYRALNQTALPMGESELGRESLQKFGQMYIRNEVSDDMLRATQGVRQADRARRLYEGFTQTPGSGYSGGFNEMRRYYEMYGKASAAAQEASLSSNRDISVSEYLSSLYKNRAVSQEGIKNLVGSNKAGNVRMAQFENLYHLRNILGETYDIQTENIKKILNATNELEANMPSGLSDYQKGYEANLYRTRMLRRQEDAYVQNFIGNVNANRLMQQEVASRLGVQTNELTDSVLRGAALGRNQLLGANEGYLWDAETIFIDHGRRGSATNVIGLNLSNIDTAKRSLGVLYSERVRSNKSKQEDYFNFMNLVSNLEKQDVIKTGSFNYNIKFSVYENQTELAKLLMANKDRLSGRLGRRSDFNLNSLSANTYSYSQLFRESMFTQDAYKEINAQLRRAQSFVANAPSASLLDSLPMESRFRPSFNQLGLGIIGEEIKNLTGWQQKHLDELSGVLYGSSGIMRDFKEGAAFTVFKDIDSDDVFLAIGSSKYKNALSNLQITQDISQAGDNVLTYKLPTLVNRTDTFGGFVKRGNMIRQNRSGFNTYVKPSTGELVLAPVDTVMEMISALRRANGEAAKAIQNDIVSQLESGFGLAATHRVNRIANSIISQTSGIDATQFMINNQYVRGTFGHLNELADQVKFMPAAASMIDNLFEIQRQEPNRLTSDARRLIETIEDLFTEGQDGLTRAERADFTRRVWRKSMVYDPVSRRKDLNLASNPNIKVALDRNMFEGQGLFERLLDYHAEISPEGYIREGYEGALKMVRDDNGKLLLSFHNKKQHVDDGIASAAAVTDNYAFAEYNSMKRPVLGQQRLPLLRANIEQVQGESSNIFLNDFLLTKKQVDNQRALSQIVSDFAAKSGLDEATKSLMGRGTGELLTTVMAISDTEIQDAFRKNADIFTDLTREGDLKKLIVEMGIVSDAKNISAELLDQVRKDFGVVSLFNVHEGASIMSQRVADQRLLGMNQHISIELTQKQLDNLTQQDIDNLIGRSVFKGEDIVTSLDAEDMVIRNDRVTGRITGILGNKLQITPYSQRQFRIGSANFTEAMTGKILSEAQLRNLGVDIQEGAFSSLSDFERSKGLIVGGVTDGRVILESIVNTKEEAGIKAMLGAEKSMASVLRSHIQERIAQYHLAPRDAYGNIIEIGLYSSFGELGKHEATSEIITGNLFKAATFEGGAYRSILSDAMDEIYNRGLTGDQRLMERAGTGQSSAFTYFSERPAEFAQATQDVINKVKSDAMAQAVKSGSAEEMRRARNFISYMDDSRVAVLSINQGSNIESLSFEKGLKWTAREEQVFGIITDTELSKAEIGRMNEARMGILNFLQSDQIEDLTLNKNNALKDYQNLQKALLANKEVFTGVKSGVEIDFGNLRDISVETARTTILPPTSSVDMLKYSLFGTDDGLAEITLSRGFRYGGKNIDRVYIPNISKATLGEEVFSKQIETAANRFLGELELYEEGLIPDTQVSRVGAAYDSYMKALTTAYADKDKAREIMRTKRLAQSGRMSYRGIAPDLRLKIAGSEAWITDQSEIADLLRKNAEHNRVDITAIESTNVKLADQINKWMTINKQGQAEIPNLTFVGLKTFEDMGFSKDFLAVEENLRFLEQHGTFGITARRPVIGAKSVQASRILLDRGIEGNTMYSLAMTMKQFAGDVDGDITDIFGVVFEKQGSPDLRDQFRTLVDLQARGNLSAYADVLEGKVKMGLTDPTASAFDVSRLIRETEEGWLKDLPKWRQSEGQTYAQWANEFALYMSDKKILATQVHGTLTPNVGLASIPNYNIRELAISIFGTNTEEGLNKLRFMDTLESIEQNIISTKHVGKSIGPHWGEAYRDAINNLHMGSEAKRQEAFGQVRRILRQIDEKEANLVDGLTDQSRFFMRTLEDIYSPGNRALLNQYFDDAMTRSRKLAYGDTAKMLADAEQLIKQDMGLLPTVSETARRLTLNTIDDVAFRSLDAAGQAMVNFNRDIGILKAKGLLYDNADTGGMLAEFNENLKNAGARAAASKRIITANLDMAKLSNAQRTAFDQADDWQRAFLGSIDSIGRNLRMGDAEEIAKQFEALPKAAAPAARQSALNRAYGSLGMQKRQLADTLDSLPAAKFDSKSLLLAAGAIGVVAFIIGANSTGKGPLIADSPQEQPKSQSLVAGQQGQSSSNITPMGGAFGKTVYMRNNNKVNASVSATSPKQEDSQSKLDTVLQKAGMDGNSNITFVNQRSAINDRWISNKISNII